MTVNRMIRCSILMAGLAIAAGCGGSDEGPQRSLDLSAALSQTMWGDALLIPGASVALGLPSASAFPSADPNACVFSSSSQSFVCPTRTVNGLTINTSFFLLDDAGLTQSSLDLNSTSSVRALLDVNGTTPLFSTSAPTTGAIHHHSDVTLSGLRSATRTLNGTSTDRDTITSSSAVTSRFITDLASTATNVVLPSGGAKYPASGTITSDATIKTEIGSQQTSSTTVHAVITFDGSSSAALTLTTSGTTRFCHLNLAAGTVNCSD